MPPYIFGASKFMIKWLCNLCQTILRVYILYKNTFESNYFKPVFLMQDNCNFPHRTWGFMYTIVQAILSSPFK